MTAPRSGPICPTAEQLAIAALCHPARAGQMAVMDLPGAFRFPNRVNSEQHIDDFGPFRAIIGGIEQPHIELDMRAVIFGQLVANRCNIVEGRNRRCHVAGRHRAQAAAADR